MKRINFETAKLAKEAGFNISFEIPPLVYTYAGRLLSLGYYQPNNVDFIFAAPYQAELQSWLRNEHNIHIYVRTDYSISSEKFYHFYTIAYLKEDCDYCEYKHGESVDTYEEAFEEGIVESLKIVINAK
jgi:hypothetical protein